MTDHDNRPHSLFGDSWRAHALKFERPLAPTHDAAAGTRILIAFVTIGVALFFALRFAIAAAGLWGLPAGNLGFVIALLAAFLILQRAYVEIPLAELGLRSFAHWTRRERLYLMQVVPLALVLFSFVFRDHLLQSIERLGFAGFLLFSLATGIIWGIAQELIYRGWLQTELTRRFGATAGLLAANIVFTFGPLHFNYLSGPEGAHWGGLAAVFAIGLFFGFLYLRSGNLCIPALLHGIWPPNMP